MRVPIEALIRDKVVGAHWCHHPLKMRVPIEAAEVPAALEAAGVAITL